MLGKKYLSKFIVFFLFILVVFLRVYKLDAVPPELFGDELDVGYQAYSILKTGRDIQGHFLPVYIQSLAEWRAPLFIYSVVPFVAVFGLNEWGVRLTAAFWGILGIVAVYFLTNQLFGNRRLALVSALWLAISPWHLHYSRAGFEVTLLLFLLTTATWLFLYGLAKPKFLTLSAVLFALTPYTYSTAAVFTPLFVLSLIVIYRRQLVKTALRAWYKAAILVFVLIFLSFGWQVAFGHAAHRFGLISVAVNPAIEKNINLSREIDKNGGFIFHNKPLSFLFEASRNYLWAFSPQFLFTDGDPVGRHSVGQMGQFYWFMLPLLLIGVFVFVRDQKIAFQSKALLFSWLIAAPIPASLTYDGGGHATRLFILLIPLVIFAGLGAVWLSTNILKNFLGLLTVSILFGIAVANLASYLHLYYVHYPVVSWRWWQIGYKDAFAYIRENQNKYEKIIINNTYEPALIRFLFYLAYDPAKFHQNFTGDKAYPGILPGFDGFRFADKFYFGALIGGPKGLEAIAPLLDVKTLYLASARDDIALDNLLGGEVAKGVQILKVVRNGFGQPIFYLLSGQ